MNIDKGIVFLGLITAATALNAEVTVELVSKNEAGEHGNDYSSAPVISADGRFVVFLSKASNLVDQDNNNEVDVFVRNLETGAVIRVTENAQGVESDGYSGHSRPSISADGRYIAFGSRAGNLVPDADLNPSQDVYVKDMQSGNLIRVSEDAFGSQGNSFSGSPSISADGRFVAFESVATNLVSAPINNNRNHVYVKNVVTGELYRASESASGEQAFGEINSTTPSISADGSLVVFTSRAGNLVPDDTNNQVDVFVKNVITGEIQRVSVDADGMQSNGDSYEASVSADGRMVAFGSSADNLVPNDTNDYSDIFVKNLETGEIVRANTDASGAQGNRGVYRLSINADGSIVSFHSNSSNLVPNDDTTEDIFVKNLLTGDIERVSEGPGGVLGSVQANGYSGWPSISADGKRVAFSSYASNLAVGDSNDLEDVFVAEVDGVNAPTTPGDFRFVVYSDTTAEVFWNRSTDNGSVRYELTRNGNTLGVLDALSYFNANHNAGVQYTYTVTAIDNDGNRSEAATLSFSTDNPIPPTDSRPGNPSMPGKLRFAVYSDSAAEIFWDRSTDDGFVQGYEIVRNDRNIGIRDAQSFLDNGLLPGFRYTYSITAIDNDGNRSATAAIVLIAGDQVKNNFPTGLRAEVYSSTTAELIWDRPVAAGLSYEIERNGRMIGLTDGVSFLDTSLVVGTEYRYRVVAIDGAGNRSADFATVNLHSLYQ